MILVVGAFEFCANDAESEMGQIIWSSARAYAKLNKLKFYK